MHGFVLYALLRKNFTAAVVLEAMWELVENTPYIINKYRNTVSNDYIGDSVLNSLMDILAMAVGWVIAASVPPWLSVLLFVASEVWMASVYRDNLSLNVLMLLYPFERIKQWQQQSP